MSKVANRVGLAESQVDVYGRIKLSRKQLARIIESLPRWTDFKCFKDGTEQLLPVNTSEPTTTPLLADIEYPDELRNDQFFFYRQGPTTKDGRAWLRKIKGNTISFNQLVQNGNFVNTTGWSATRGTISTSNNVLTYTITDIGTTYIHNRIGTPFVTVIGHKYFLTATVKPKYRNTLSLRFNGSDDDVVHFSDITADSWNYLAGIITPVGVSDQVQIAFNTVENYSVGDTIQVQNYMVFDLTLMGIDNLTTTQEVEAWLSSHVGDLPYYAYDPGSLISFNGTGIKTIGKNLFDGVVEEGRITNGQNASQANRYRSKNYIPVLPGRDYVFSKNGNATSINPFFYNANKEYIGTSAFSSLFTTPSDCYYVRFFSDPIINVDSGLQLEIGSSATPYEPYTSNTLSLPIEDFFSTGMKSVGTVFDELNGVKAITRVGVVDLGSLDWTYSSGDGFFYTTLSNYYYPTDASQRVAPLKCAKYITVSQFGREDETLFGLNANTNTIAIQDSNYEDVDEFKEAMDGVLLYYELAEPTEEPVLDLN